jgi:hypothetical protein
VESLASNGSPGAAVAAMTERAAASPIDREQTLRELQELVAALDRRVPQVERVGEIAIARAAAALREEALRRIAELGEENPVETSFPD